MDKKTFEKMGKIYGDVASWCIWAPELDRPKSNIGNLTVFDVPNLHELVNPNYAFVALNVSGARNPDAKIVRWESFHSPYGKHHDYKLRYALKDTPYWGSYITDLIKNFPELHSENVMSFIKRNPDVLKQNIDEFREEMAMLGHPVLVALGGTVYDLLMKTLSDEFTIVGIKHYSFRMSKENYRKELLERMTNIKGV